MFHPIRTNSVFHSIVASFLKSFDLFCSLKILIALKALNNCKKIGELMTPAYIAKKFKTIVLLSNTIFDCFKQIQMLSSCICFQQRFWMIYILCRHEKDTVSRRRESFMWSKKFTPLWPSLRFRNISKHLFKSGVNLIKLLM